MNKEKFIDRIRNRFPPAEAAEVIAALERARCDQTLYWMCMRHGEEVVTHYMGEARGAITAYRVWRNRNALMLLAKAFHDREGDILRERARATVALYLDARRDQRDLRTLNEGGENLFNEDE